MNSKIKLGIIDYGFCNIQSVYSSCTDATTNVEIINLPKEIEKYDKIILPGVGNFESAATTLLNLGFYESIKIHVSKEKDLLGICLGMQLLFNKSEEAVENVIGLSFLDGNVLDLRGFVKQNTPVPHMGWSELFIQQNDLKLLEDIEDKSSFYFANSYFCETRTEDLFASFEHGGKKFPSIVSNNKNVYGVQFHPEKSQKKGIQIIRNFVNA